MASGWHPFRMLDHLESIRWCRFAQPPANGCEPSGFVCALDASGAFRVRLRLRWFPMPEASQRLAGG